METVAANKGTFATKELDVEPGHGFNGGTNYCPKATSLGTWGAVVPGHIAGWNEGAWMGY